MPKKSIQEREAKEIMQAADAQKENTNAGANDTAEIIQKNINSIYNQRRAEKDANLEKIEGQLPEIEKEIRTLQASMKNALEKGDLEAYEAASARMESRRAYIATARANIDEIKNRSIFTQEEAEILAEQLKAAYMAGDFETRRVMADLTERMEELADMQAARWDKANYALSRLHTEGRFYTMDNDTTINWGRFMTMMPEKVRRAYAYTEQGKQESNY